MSRDGSEVLHFADLALDPTRHEVIRSGQQIDLTLTEYMLLELFLKHPREVLPRGLIFRAAGVSTSDRSPTRSMSASAICGGSSGPAASVA